MSKSALSGSCWHAGVLHVRLSGAEGAVDAAVRRLGGDAYARSGEFWRSVREQTHRFFTAAAQGGSLWRLSVRSTAPHEELGSGQLIEWGGALRWIVARAGADSGSIRKWATAYGGHATLFRGGNGPGAFTPLDATIATLHKRLKATFDPHGILNRGRLYADF